MARYTLHNLVEHLRGRYTDVLGYLERGSLGADDQARLRRKIEAMTWVLDDLEFVAKQFGEIPGSGPNGALQFPDDLPKYEVTEVLARIERIKIAQDRLPVEAKNDSDKPRPELEPVVSPPQMSMFGSALRK